MSEPDTIEQIARDDTIPTPPLEQDADPEGDGVCGYPVDRTGDDWPGDAAEPREVPS